jgi:hypothetical protein
MLTYALQEASANKLRAAGTDEHRGEEGSTLGNPAKERRVGGKEVREKEVEVGEGWSHSEGGGGVSINFDRFLAASSKRLEQVLTYADVC